MLKFCFCVLDTWNITFLLFVYWGTAFLNNGKNIMWKSVPLCHIFLITAEIMSGRSHLFGGKG